MFATLGLRLSLAKREDFEGFQSSINNHFNQPQHICAAIMLKNLIFRFWQEE
jgi:hypothetical protein